MRTGTRPTFDELDAIAARSGMRELAVRTHLHRGALGEAGSAVAARLLAREIDNPVLSALVGLQAQRVRVRGE